MATSPSTSTIQTLVDYISLIICALSTKHILPKAIVNIIKSYYIHNDKYLLLIAISPELMDNSTISVFNLKSNYLTDIKIQNKSVLSSHQYNQGGRDIITNIHLPQNIDLHLESQPYLNPFKWNILLRIGGYKDGELTDECHGVAFNSDEYEYGYHIELPPYIYKDNPQIIYNEYYHKIYCLSATERRTNIITLDTNVLQYDIIKDTQLHVPHSYCSLCWNSAQFLCILGGVDGDGKQCEILDIENDQCIQIAALHKRRIEAGSVIIQQMNDTVICGAGYGDYDQDRFKTENTIEMYDPYKDIWSIYPKQTQKDRRSPKLFCFNDNPYVLCICGEGRHFITNRFGPNEYIERIDLRDSNAEWQYVPMHSESNTFFNVKEYQYSMDHICVSDF